MKYAILHLLLLSSFNTLLAQLTPPHFYHVPPQSGVVNSYFMFPASLFIFTQAEIAGMVGPVSGPIEIGAIWFRHGGGSDGLFTDLSNFKIRMGHTTLVNPVPVFDDNFNAGAPQTVLSKAVYTYTPYLANVQDPTVGWTAINLDTPFVYNFTDNLCIEMSFSATSDFIYPNYASVDSWSATGFPLTRTAFTYGDDTASIDVPRPMFGLSGPVDGGPDGDPVCLDYLPGDDSPAIFIVPDSVQGISVKLWGGAGGGGPSGAGDAPGGGGGYAEFELAVTPGEEIAIVVGKGGQAADGQAGGLGGWPGAGGMAEVATASRSLLAYLSRWAGPVAAAGPPSSGAPTRCWPWLAAVAVALQAAVAVAAADWKASSMRRPTCSHCLDLAARKQQEGPPHPTRSAPTLSLARRVRLSREEQGPPT